MSDIDVVIAESLRQKNNNSTSFRRLTTIGRPDLVGEVRDEILPCQKVDGAP